MKNTKIYVLALAAFFVAACASPEENEGNDENSLEIPEAVMATFNETFPDAAEVEWSTEGEDYEAEFEVGELEYEVVFNAAGNVMEAELDIDIDELPMLAQDYIAENYPNVEIEEMKKVSNNDGNFYEVEFKEDGLEVELIFNVNGEFVESILEDGDGDEGEEIEITEEEAV